MRFDPLESAQDEVDEIENEEQLENEDSLTHIDPTDEWLNFRHVLAHDMFNGWRERNPR